MKKNYTTLVVVLAICVFAVVVYAVTDTDGGYNPDEPGICIARGQGSNTDFCQNSTLLTEYYPAVIGEFCLVQNVTCNCSINKAGVGYCE